MSLINFLKLWGDLGGDFGAVVMLPLIYITKKGNREFGYKTQT